MISGAYDPLVICNDCLAKNGCARLKATKPFKETIGINVLSHECFSCLLAKDELKCPDGHRIVQFNDGFSVQQKKFVFWMYDCVFDKVLVNITPYGAYIRMMELINTERTYAQAKKDHKELFTKWKNNNGKIICGDR